MSDTLFEMNDKGDVLFLHADMREALKALPENSVDSVVTDPPYHLQSIVKRFSNTSETDNTKTSERVRNRVDGYARLAGTGFMGARWDGGDIAFQVDTWREVLRVLKPGGHIAAFGGTRTFHRMACAIEDAGFEIRDTLMWCYGSGFPKSHDVSKGIDKAAGAERKVIGPPRYSRGKTEQRYSETRKVSFDCDPQPVTAPATDAAKEWQGWGTALKPAVEPVILARKPLSEKTVAANVLRWRTGAINVDGCRVEYKNDADKASATPQGKCTSKTGSLAGKVEYPGCDDYAPDVLHPDETGRDVCTNCYYKGIDHRPRKEYVRPEQKGRWPANLIHDGSDEVVAMFPDTKSGAMKRRVGAYEGESITGFLRGDSGPHNQHGDSGSAARFFYASKASKADRAGSSHSTVKPISLMRWLTRLITPPGGLVLDPFAGSGTTGAAALEEGMRCLLIEREAEYADDIRRRLSISDIGLI